MNDKDITIMTLAGMLVKCNERPSEYQVHNLNERLTIADRRVEELETIVNETEHALGIDLSVPSDNLPHIAAEFKRKADAFDKLEPIVEKIRLALEMDDRLADEEIPIEVIKVIQDAKS
jgi:hypothetical protein